MSEKYDTAASLFADLLRQYPRYPTTFSQCACGRMQARGGGKCALCITEELGTVAGHLLASQAHEAIREVARAWAEIEEVLSGAEGQ